MKREYFRTIILINYRIPPPSCAHQQYEHRTGTTVVQVHTAYNALYGTCVVVVSIVFHAFTCGTVAMRRGGGLEGVSC